MKAPTAGSFSQSIDLTIPGGLPVNSCLLLGLNGGPVAQAQAVTMSASLTLSYTAPQAPTQSLIGAGGEFCFGMNGGPVARNHPEDTGVNVRFDC